MAPLKPIVAVTVALVFLSFSVTIASDSIPEDTADSSVAVSVSVEVDAPAESAPAAAKSTETPRSQLATIKATMRAGVNLTKALYRAATHNAIVIARTIYHTATALT